MRRLRWVSGVGPGGRPLPQMIDNYAKQRYPPPCSSHRPPSTSARNRKRLRSGKHICRTRRDTRRIRECHVATDAGPPAWLEHPPIHFRNHAKSSNRPQTGVSCTGARCLGHGDEPHPTPKRSPGRLRRYSGPSAAQPNHGLTCPKFPYQPRAFTSRLRCSPRRVA